jgi:hypothetical protein
LEEDFDRYVERMGRDGVYGGNLELVACARVFDCGIAIHQPALDIWFIGETSSSKIIHLVYEYEHYSSAISIDKTVSKAIFEAKEKGQSSLKVNESPKMTKQEEMIMKMVSPAIFELTKVRQLLVKYRNKHDKVIDHLLEEADAVEDGTKDISQETGPQIPEPPEQIKEAKIHPQRLTGRQKKDLKHKLKREKRMNSSSAKSKLENHSVENSLTDSLSVLSI